MSLTIGAVAPNFSLPDQAGIVHELKSTRGQWVLLYFYPKDDTPGCTKEACALRDHWKEFTKIGAQVFGISTDSVKSHGKFAAKFDLSFPILSDEDKHVVELYGVWGKKKFMGREYTGTFRHSFLIDPKGNIAKIYTEVKPEKHAEEVLQDIQLLSS